MGEANSSELGETMVKRMIHYNVGGWQSYGDCVYLYGHSLTLDPTKTVLGIMLPQNSDIKILAMDLSQAGRARSLPAILTAAARP